MLVITLIFEVEKTELIADEDSLLLMTIDSTEQETNEFVFDEDSLDFDQEEFSFDDSTNAFEMAEETFLSPLDSILAIGYELFEEGDETDIYYKVNHAYHNYYRARAQLKLAQEGEMNLEEMQNVLNKLFRKYD